MVFILAKLPTRRVISVLFKAFFLFTCAQFLFACASAKPYHTNTSLDSGVSLSLQATLMGDPDGKIDTYFSDNSVATEAVEFSPDGKLFASVSKSKNSQAQLKLWRSDDLSLIWQVSLTGETESVTFDKDAKRLVVGGENAQGEGNLQVYSVADAQLLWSAPSELYPKSIEGMRFAPDYNKLATGDENGAVVVWDTSEGSPENWRIVGKINVRNAPDAVADVNQVDWTEDSRYFITAERDGDVNMYDVFSISKTLRPQPVKRFQGFASHTVKSVRISPDNRYVAAGAGGTQGVRVWRLADAGLVRHIASEASPLAETGKVLNAERYETVAFTPDSQQLVVGGTWPSWWFNANQEPNIGHKVPLVMFDMKNLESAQEPLQFITFDAWRTEYLDFSEQNNLMLSGHDDGSIRVWKLERLP